VIKAQASAGTVVSIWRYPVKSMLGEELNSSYVTERGLIGDRSYALVDQETGKVASAKNPRKWGNLFDFRATLMDPPQVIENIPPVRPTAPDGTQIFSDQNDIDHALSNVFGRDVRLMSCLIVWVQLIWSRSCNLEF
jgi:uncharacterized protein